MSNLGEWCVSNTHTFPPRRSKWHAKNLANYGSYVGFMWGCGITCWMLHAPWLTPPESVLCNCYALLRKCKRINRIHIPWKSKSIVTWSRAKVWVGFVGDLILSHSWLPDGPKFNNGWGLGFLKVLEGSPPQPACEQGCTWFGYLIGKLKLTGESFEKAVKHWGV